MCKIDLYTQAIRVLNRIHTHPQRHLQKKRQSGKERTQQWIDLLGINKRLRSIPTIHVAGTKGKGTTCLYVERIISEYSRRQDKPKKFGCLTSPHVTDICERIRLDSSNIQKGQFATYFFRLWDDMQKISQNRHTETPNVPGYAGFLTLLGFYILVHENVGLAIVETGIGGEHDSTNIIAKPLVTGITSLGLDHVNVLGDNIERIAWHKAGIFKPACPAFTVPQAEEAMRVLRQRAHEKDTELQTVSEGLLQQYGVKVYPNMKYQKYNASLAIQLSDTALKQLDPTFEMSIPLARVLENTELPGRNEILKTKKNSWFLSTAHNEMSVLETAKWLAQELQLPAYLNAPRILIFNHDSSKRDSKSLLAILYEHLGDSLLQVVFCSNHGGIDGEKPDFFDHRRKLDIDLMKRHAALWTSLGAAAPVHIELTVDKAVQFVENKFTGVNIIVAGSLYLAGTVRYILDKDR